MKTLTVRNPWCYLITKGIKDIENRSRRTKFRGTILIHAAKTWDKNFRAMDMMFTRPQWDSLDPNTQYRMVTGGNFKVSSIIGQVDIVDCIQDSKSVWAIPDQWHWVLENPKLFTTPIENIKGQLGLWNYNEKI